MSKQKILKELKNNKKIHLILAGMLINGWILGQNNKKICEDVLVFAKKELIKVIKKALDEQRKEIIEELEKIPVEYPNYESDDYDNGNKRFKEEILKFLNKNNN